MVFVDTWGWISLYNQREPSHNNVKIFYRKCRLSRTNIYTTDYVLDETLTLIFRRLPFELAKRSMNAINTAIRQGFLILEGISPARFEYTQVMRLKYDDKPLISFTDLTSMAVMQEIGIKDIITEDSHFEHVGLGFVCRP